MLSHKLEFDDIDYYQLVAIHSSMEEYKMAYFLNKHLDLRLKRSHFDLDFNHGEIQALYPLFDFKEPENYRSYYLIKNKFKGSIKKVVSSGSLFIEEDISSQITYLIPEYKEVDYFLKIEDDTEGEEQSIINKIAFIPQVITTYMVDINQLKSKNNLILD